MISEIRFQDRDWNSGPLQPFRVVDAGIMVIIVAQGKTIWIPKPLLTQAAAAYGSDLRQLYLRGVKDEEIMAIFNLLKAANGRDDVGDSTSGGGTP